MRHGVDVDMQFGMLAPQLGQPREQPLLREKRQDVEVQAQQGIWAARLGDDRAQLVENRRKLSLERTPRLGQAEPMMVAVEEGPPDDMFERLDAPRQRGHRQAELDRGRLDRAVTGNLQKGFHAAEGRKARHNDRG